MFKVLLVHPSANQRKHSSLYVWYNIQHFIKVPANMLNVPMFLYLMRVPDIELNAVVGKMLTNQLTSPTFLLHTLSVDGVHQLVLSLFSTVMVDILKWLQHLQSVTHRPCSHRSPPNLW